MFSPRVTVVYRWCTACGAPDSGKAGAVETLPRQMERPSPTARAGLVRYLTAATLARSADGGAAVGLVLLALSAWPGHHGSLVGGILATCLTAPHLLGPVLARRLDRARDGRGLLAAAFAGYAVAIGAATLTIGQAPVVVTAAL